ncbi:hypothetical protein PENSPDRAFT_753255 [Peniophora sp. CONT]|nr:hypothetical protein PENSPDRAFT_753255 [Peniophora sp. CONT]
MVSRLALVAAAAVAASSAYGYDYSSEPSYATTTSMYEAPAYTTSSSYGYEPASSSYYEEPSYTSSSEYAAPAYTDASYEPSYDNKMRKSYKKHYGDNYKKQYDEPATYEDPDEAELAYYMKKDYQPAAETKTCNKGDLQCCNSVQSAKSTDFSKVLSSDVYSVIPDMMAGSNAPVGLTCSPLIQSLSGGVQCNQQTVCCDGGHFSGLISINCIAFNPGSQAAGII